MVRLKQRLVVVEMRDRIADAAGIGGHGRRSAEAFENEIGRSVVALGHRRRAELRQRDGVADAVFQRRRIGHQIGALEHEGAVETLAAGLDALEHGRDGEHLEGAAQRETLIAAIVGARAGRRIEHCDAEVAAAFSFDRRKVTLQRCRESGGRLRQAESRANSGGRKPGRDLPTCYLTMCEMPARGHHGNHAAVGAFPVRPSRLSR